MSDVLEAVDLSRAFIRGGVTQTGLFAADDVRIEPRPGW